MSAELPKMRQDFSDWWRSLPQDQRYDFDSEGRGYKKPAEVLMWAAWQEAARQAMERAIAAVEFEKVEADETKHHHDYLYNAALDHAKDGIRRALLPQSEKRHG